MIPHLPPRQTTVDRFEDTAIARGKTDVGITYSKLYVAYASRNISRVRYPRYAAVSRDMKPGQVTVYDAARRDGVDGDSNARAVCPGRNTSRPCHTAIMRV